MLQITGYADRWSVRAGQELDFMVHCGAPEGFEARVLRIDHGDPNPAGPGFQTTEVVPPWRQPACPQVSTPLGSYGATDRAMALPDGMLIVRATVWPTLPGCDQTIVALRGSFAAIRLGIDAAGAFAAVEGEGLDTARLSVARPVFPRRWYVLTLRYDQSSGHLSISQEPLSPVEGNGERGVAERNVQALRIGTAAVSIAATAPGTNCFDGKIERPEILLGGIGASDDTVVARWDFSLEMDGTRFLDTGPQSCHGRFVNMPARAMTGSNWRRDEFCWRRAPQQWGAVHFHSDDLYDIGWLPNVRVGIPQDARPGLYALHVKTDSASDHIPFVVRAGSADRARRILLLVPTMSYQVYGNTHRPGRGEHLRDKSESWNAHAFWPDEHPEYGRSPYNHHLDGSGVCFASSRRPLIDIRPNQILAVDEKGSGTMRLTCDTYICHWLDHLGVSYDVATDHDLHAEGAELLRRYDVLVTGQHPEYVSAPMLDAIERWLGDGGRLLYLGGNGFYWKVVLDPSLPGLIELRRAESGIRAWATEPGEAYHQLDGSYGGLWRRLGRPPQALVGVGFSAQGDYSAQPYERLAASDDPRVAFAFEGIPEQVLGDFGLMAGGAAGLEFDRADVGLGTPPHALVVARACGSPAHFSPVNEEMLMAQPPRPLDELMRSDITFFETPAGGAVFSVGSMTYVGSLSHNSYDNNIARLTSNVLRRFLDPQPFARNAN